jgi:nucleotide-binding universal stress UspA family protein
LIDLNVPGRCATTLAPYWQGVPMFKHLFIPVDGTDLAERAMDSGIALAQQLDASITAFIAEPPPPLPASDYGASRYARELAQHDGTASDHAKGVLSSFERRAAAVGVRFNGVHTQTHLIDEAIADTAREQGCDMIVMVTHGRGAFGELLFGSRTKGVMARSKLPLLVLH